MRGILRLLWAYAGTEMRDKYVFFLKEGNLNSTQVKAALGVAVVL